MALGGTASEEAGMEVHPGVFVSNIATEEWQADPEIGGGAEEHVLFDTGTMRAGLSRFTKDADQQPPTWVLPATQVLLVLEGEARVEIEDGPVLELKAGDMACLPKGAATACISHFRSRRCGCSPRNRVRRSPVRWPLLFAQSATQGRSAAS